jgi:hypothetical protein
MCALSSCIAAACVWRPRPVAHRPLERLDVREIQFGPCARPDGAQVGGAFLGPSCESIHAR